jgi:hypothetical protein
MLENVRIVHVFIRSYIDKFSNPYVSAKVMFQDADLQPLLIWYYTMKYNSEHITLKNQIRRDVAERLSAEGFDGMHSDFTGLFMDAEQKVSFIVSDEGKFPLKYVFTTNYINRFVDEDLIKIGLIEIKD